LNSRERNRSARHCKHTPKILSRKRCSLPDVCIATASASLRVRSVQRSTKPGGSQWLVHGKHPQVSRSSNAPNAAARSHGRPRLAPTDARHTE
jgi:hypothetical protein